MKQAFKTALAASVMALVSSTSAFAATNLVQNGSFEDLSDGVRGTDAVAASTWGTWSEIGGWTDQGGTNFEIQTNATLGSIDAQDGNNYVELDAHRPRNSSNAQIGQIISMTAGTYELSFYYSPRVRNNTSGSTNDIVYSVGTLLTGAIEGAPNADFPHREWTEVSALFEVTADGDYNLLFGGDGHQDTLGGFIDNVSISAVPLPAGMLLLLSGLGGMAAMRRRKG